ncbi:MAG TPA: DUF3786 domain-containing protein [Desulfurivibrionaceae bacterium]|nr:DUF3786 domain-containing protein [Desulfurivibrionaceae bacterium]
MKPMEVVARTPKSNCRECGYPTCLAFGAAVAATGLDPRRCPYINLEGLEVQPAGVALEEVARQRDLALVEHLKGKIAGADFAALAPRLGATWDEAAKVMTFAYLGQEVVLSKATIRIDGREPEDPRDQILLYNYVHSGGGPPPAGPWLGLESLPNSISKVRTLATYCEAPLARLFSGRSPEQIIADATLMGGAEVINPGATLTLLFPVLPRLPQQVIFWAEELEDGFAARVKILFDPRVLEFLDIESLVFSAERLAERLTALIAEKE